MASALPAVKDLTDSERDFVRECGKGTDPALSAVKAGFTEQDSWQLMRRPRVQAALHQEVRRALDADAPISLKVLKEIRNDEAAPARTRADIAIKLLGMAGHGAKEHKNEETKQLSDMSPAELRAYIDRNEAEIQRLEGELISRAKDVTNQTGGISPAKPLSFLD